MPLVSERIRGNSKRGKIGKSHLVLMRVPFVCRIVPRERADSVAILSSFFPFTFITTEETFPFPSSGIFYSEKNARRWGKKLVKIANAEHNGEVGRLSMGVEGKESSEPDVRSRFTFDEAFHCRGGKALIAFFLAERAIVPPSSFISFESEKTSWK